MTKLTQKYLKKRLHYNPDDGSFTWLKFIGHPPKWNVKHAGKRAGVIKYSKGTHYYVLISIDKKRYRAHRLAFLYMTGKFPSDCVDHKDNNGLNNRWDNLRAATVTQNNQYRIVQSNNKCGLKGVSLNKQKIHFKKCYQAQICINGKKKNLGFHATPEEASMAYQVAAKKYFGEFAKW